MKKCVICGRRHIRNSEICIFCQYRVDAGMKAVKEVNCCNHDTRTVAWFDGNMYPKMDIYTAVDTETFEKYAETVKGRCGALMLYNSKRKPVFNWSYFKAIWWLAAKFVVQEQRAVDMLGLLFPEYITLVGATPCYVSSKLEIAARDKGEHVELCSMCPIKWPGKHCTEGYGLIRKYEDALNWGQYNTANETALEIFNLPLSDKAIDECCIDDILVCTDELGPFDWNAATSY